MFERLSNGLKTSASFFLRPIPVLSGYRRANLRPDLVAGLTVAVILLPQAIAYALIAGMPPQAGIYTAILATIVGALWGSSNQLQTGPTNTASLLVLSTLLPIAAPGTPRFLAAASLLALMIGIFRLLLGLARLGMLVNFVSDSVIIGFSAGSGVLIWASQMGTMLRVNVPNSPGIVPTLQALAANLRDTHWPSLALGVIVVLLVWLQRRLNRKIPGALIAMSLAGLAVWIFSLQGVGIKVIGAVTVGIPPLADFTRFNLDLISQLSTGALAIGAIGLVEALSIARSVASQTGQRLDSNQEFIGQGLANIASGLVSGFPSSGSYNRTAVNHSAGAKTPLASVFSGLFVLVAALLLGPFTAYVPRAAVAGVLIVIAYGMIDRKEIARILKGAPGDVLIMLTTFVAVLLLPLQFAVLTGILISFAVYILRTSVPRVVCVVPDDQFKHLTYQPKKPLCPQLAIFSILGDLYFGAVSNVEKTLLNHLEQHPDERYLLLSMESVNQCDISGVHILENILRTCRDRSGDLFFRRLQEPVMQTLDATGFSRLLGSEHVLDEDEAITYLFHRILDPAICIYECEVRVFLECQNLPKQIALLERVPLHTQIPAGQVELVSPQQLWKQLHSANPPLVIDVREPREFQQGHIPQAQLIPLGQLLGGENEIPHDRPIVLVCRGGRRAGRASYALSRQGYQAQALAGGMLAWENAGLLEAME